MKTTISLFLLLLLVFSLLADGIDVRADFDDGPEGEASSIDALAIFLGFQDSGRLRSRQPGAKLSALLRGFGARPENFLSAPRIKQPSSFSQQELFSLQRVYRL